MKNIVFVLVLVVFSVVNITSKNVFFLRTAVSEEGQGKLSQFELVGYDPQGKKKWQICGKSADILSKVVQLNNIFATAYADGKKVIIEADRGTVDKKTNNVQLRDNVVATTSDGAKLTTEKLNWLAKDERIKTDAKVNIEKDNMHTEAVGAEAQKGMQKVQLKKDVKVRLNNPTMTITCDGPLSLDYPNNIATFYNNVKVIDERGQLHADRMDVYFDSKTSSINKVVAIGNVKIIRGENVSYSEKAIYIASENKLILEGSPKLEVFAPEGKEGKGMDSLF